MKTKIKYTDEPMGKTRAVKDFLPPPDQLVLKEEHVKVTIALNKTSVDFFKKEAKNHTCRENRRCPYLIVCKRPVSLNNL